jgi:hypothetical protein
MSARREPFTFSRRCRSSVFAGSTAKRSLNRSTKLGRKVVACSNVSDLSYTQPFHESVLQRAVGSLDAALGLAGVGAEDLDVELRQSAAERGHTLAALGVRPVDAEDGVLVRVKATGQP